MNSSRFNENIYWQLFRFALSMKHHIIPLAEEHGLTVTQLYTLCFLDKNGSLPMNSLSSLLYCDASNVTGIVDRLLHQSYIKREENPKDRREKIITLTPQGRALCEKVSQQMDKLQILSKPVERDLQVILSKVLPLE